ncbi:C1GALT1-specific chaperone 1-like protein [Venturia canescens]|uniref:C1GALT1-specific chaperone 1-like protein n=1 Tax=Venturia canescens TaxID=32260 RepID=UPI001C9BDBC0|nr:C1GALT1-specific chaperone 1-like protein [Venturia canescens]XP_043269409.1 C1GALT1-specific chaperone 1-like protein [Venturia canescens]XP_043269411.1 C1GALT1-specific chaperone 1-like protein [Venturia canescens]XP_043269412.1 C1GALT1-specific chaperone 1-like protein [Venturia canescens]XP_043269413.1 C1GALT1-specific chaperone 1-like protein [Venturia canescens]
MLPCSPKRKCVFVIGFMIGFATALLIFSVDDEHHDSGICEPHYSWLCNDRRYLLMQKQLLSKPGKSIQEEITGFGSQMNGAQLNVKANSTYDSWLKAQNVTTTNIDMDLKQYGPKGKAQMAKKVLESEWLKSKIHVTCIVFVEKLKRAESIVDSWGSSCNKLYFFSDRLNDTKLSVLQFPIKLVSSWQMLCETMKYIWKFTKNSDSSDSDKILEWAIFVKDDTMVIPENLRYLVASLDYNQGHYLGHPVVLWGQAYNVAQAGFVLSKLAFRKIVENFNTSQKCMTGGKYWKKEDYYLGKHLALLGIHPSDTRDHRLRGVFHGYALQTLLWGIARPGSYFTRALYPPGHNCCSPRSISFSTSDPDKMYTVNYMLYHLHVYARPGIYGNDPAPTPMPEEEVWKSALREEFNITDFSHVDSDRYYEIWSSRYSGPEQLIRKNIWNLKNRRRLSSSDHRTKSVNDN